MIHSYSKSVSLNDPNSAYGSDLEAVMDIADENKKYEGLLSEELKISRAQLIWAIREEMARTVEDFLARRTRALFLDARESIRIAGEVASMMADELGYKDEWIQAQVQEFNQLARGYYLD
jgi:glycerol-3-phosphate dehydrogenase